ncbi:hypothetical protein [Cyclobacterium xiamenense]|uniref:hypothetical protein n=1 Tax=Cyclobacterium xiamenense TaxID=1297121 RepID=UPI0035CED8EE
MTAFSDSQLVAKANAIGSKTEENSIDPQLIAAMFNDIILNKWNKDSPLPKGDKGDKGDTGDPGPSAYQAWLDLGNSGTEQDFINSLKGDKGDQGDAGDDGLSAYQVWLNEGNSGSEADFLLDIKGDNGDQGDAGDDGLSAYQVWLNAGNTGSESDFLLDIKGDKGEKGDAGDDGLSAYQVWLNAGNTGSESDFLLDIKGDKGDQGNAGDEGLSAYQVWLNEGNSGSEQDFIDSLQGSPDTPAEIVTKLSSITEEAEKLPNTAIQGSGINGNQLGVNAQTGALYVKTDEEPTENSAKFISSGDHFAYEQANPRGGALTPGFLTTLAATADTFNGSIRRIVGRNGVFYACNSNVGNDRLHVSLDGRVFFLGGDTSSLSYYALDVAPHGTIILGGRGGGPDNVRRSTNGGGSFDTITLPASIEITGIVYIAAGRWALCARTGDGSGNVAAWSEDDGASWTMATTDGTNAMEDIAAANGLVFMVSNNGTNRFQLSTDGAETFTAKPVSPNEFFTRCCFFNNHLVLMRSGTGLKPHIVVSGDQGDTWEGRLDADASGNDLKGMAVIGDWLYLFGASGYIIRTKDLSTKDLIPAPTANTIVAMGWTYIDGKAVIMAACENGTNNRILSTNA